MNPFRTILYRDYSFAKFILATGIHTPKRIMLIDHGIYEYGYFNACFLQNMMSLMMYSINRGYIPHINLKDRGDGWTNWDTFFEQPFNTANDCLADVVCDRDSGHLSPQFNTPYRRTDLRMWCKVYDRLIKLNGKTKDYVEQEYNKVLAPHERVLGVICRGTDYIKLKPQGHPVQPNIPDVVKKTKEMTNQYGYQYIYLATEERSIHETFEEAFPGKVLVNKRQYYDDIFNAGNHTYLYQVNFDRKDDIYLKGLEYLSSLQLLSRCDALVGGNCGGACAALYMNNMKYEHVELFNLGLYP